jgi:hypothetical protein
MRNTYLCVCCCVAQALCEASKYIFYLETEHGPIYKPSTRDFELALLEPSETETNRLKSIWCYWEADTSEDVATEDEPTPHPDRVFI